MYGNLAKFLELSTFCAIMETWPETLSFEKQLILDISVPFYVVV